MSALYGGLSSNIAPDDNVFGYHSWPTIVNWYSQAIPNKLSSNNDSSSAL